MDFLPFIDKGFLDTLFGWDRAQILSIWTERKTHAYKDFILSVIILQVSFYATFVFALFGFWKRFFILNRAEAKENADTSDDVQFEMAYREMIEDVAVFFLNAWLLISASFCMVFLVTGSYLSHLSLDEQAVLFVGCCYVIFYKGRVISQKVRKIKPIRKTKSK